VNGLLDVPRGEVPVPVGEQYVCRGQCSPRPGRSSPALRSKVGSSSVRAHGMTRCPSAPRATGSFAPGFATRSAWTRSRGIVTVRPRLPLVVCLYHSRRPPGPSPPLCPSTTAPADPLAARFPRIGESLGPGRAFAESHASPARRRSRRFDRHPRRGRYPGGPATVSRPRLTPEQRARANPDGRSSRASANVGEFANPFASLEPGQRSANWFLGRFEPPLVQVGFVYCVYAAEG
jgi:hypothetical protein